MEGYLPKKRNTAVSKIVPSTPQTNTQYPVTDVRLPSEYCPMTSIKDITWPRTEEAKSLRMDCPDSDGRRSKNFMSLKEWFANRGQNYTLTLRFSPYVVDKTSCEV